MVACHLAVLAAVLAPGVPSDQPAPPPPAPRDVRGAVRRGLPYVETVAAAWMRERKCNSCHTVTFLVWAHNQAAARGFDVDRKKLAEWTKWSLADSLADRFWFQLRPRALAALKAEGVPEALLGKLTPLEGKTYLTRPDYLRALGEAAGRAELEAHRDRLVRQAALPNNGGGPDTLSQLLLGRAAPGPDKGEKESYAAVRALLLEWQEPDGSWRAQGQLPGLKWGERRRCTRPRPCGASWPWARGTRPTRRSSAAATGRWSR